MHPISIKVYPLFGHWRAECQSCGAYGNSQYARGASQIGLALEALASRPITFSPKSKDCHHNYGSYKPRVTCFVDYNHLKFINDCVFITKGCEKFPAILLDNKYVVNVVGAQDLTHEWSAYSFVRFSAMMDKEHKRKKHIKAEFKAGQEALRESISHATQTIQQMALECKSKSDSAIEKKRLWDSVGKHISGMLLICSLLWVTILVVATFGIPTATFFLKELEEKSSYRLQLKS